MDKFKLRTDLVILFYEYVDKNPHNLNEDQKKKLLQDILTLVKTMQKVESAELVQFLKFYNLIDAKDKNVENKIDTNI